VKPRVSFIMGVWNGERYLGEALASMLAQTFDDFEIVIVDDGSTDRTPEILAGINDPRLQIVRQPNRGLSSALNAAVRTATGELLARHDADDISLPERLARQVSYLDKHPTCAALGTWAVKMDPDGRARSHMRVPTSPRWMRFAMTYRDPFLHPTVIFRRQALEAVGGYDESVRYSQDSALWRRLVLRFDVANLPEALYRYRIHPAAIGRARRREQTESHRVVCRGYRSDYVTYYARLDRPTVVERLTRAAITLQGLRDRLRLNP
jgi:glycosyltransferase involved in cell wall biosynthesis